MIWMHPNTSEILQVLHKAMKGLGTDDTTLIRVIVTRTEIDMQYIKAEYLKKYKKTLNDVPAITYMYLHICIVRIPIKTK